MTNALEQLDVFANFKPTGLKKVINSAELKRLLMHARELKFDHNAADSFIDELDPQGYHLAFNACRHKPCLAFWAAMYGDDGSGEKVGFNFAHNNGVNIRATVLCKMKGTAEPRLMLFDFDERDFLALKDYVADEYDALSN